MKLLICAHKPPPYHGQSFVIQQIVEGLGSVSEDGKDKIEILHLDIRFSKDVADVGKNSVLKIFLLFHFVAKLIGVWIAERPGVIYYVPAPGKRIAIWRDWAFITTARILGMRRVYHWMAGGLSEWLETHASPVEKYISKKVYSGAVLSIIPVESERPNASYFFPKHIVKIFTGIADPCPEFDELVLPARLQRLEQRRAVRANAKAQGVLFRVLFMGHCTADKGLFDTLDAVIAVNAQLEKTAANLRCAVDVFGKFMSEEEQLRFKSYRSDQRFQWQKHDGTQTLLTYCEFVGGSDKSRVFKAADVLCFPSYYSAEAIPTVVIDAGAYGLPIVSTNWRGIPELVPPDVLPLCDIRSHHQITHRLVEAMEVANFSSYRKYFIENFARDKFLKSIYREVSRLG